LFLKRSWHGIAIDRDKRLLRQTLLQFLIDTIAQFVQRLRDVHADKVPVRFLGVPHEIRTDLPGSVPNPGGIGAEVRIANHFFHVLEPLGPLPEIGSRQRTPPFIAARRPAGPQTVRVPRGAIACIIACGVITRIALLRASQPGSRIGITAPLAGLIAASPLLIAFLLCLITLLILLRTWSLVLRLAFRFALLLP
jgi:hypothetical protein